ncbi:MAG: gamma carbonic anhydrase family protein [Spirochaetia bacterium]|nr:gamma carbonic anhydrase family protein [Spirochaetia bacterium]
MLYRIENKTPGIDSSVFLAPDASIVGDVTIGENSSVWFHCTLRGDGFPVKIGKFSNIQDNSVIHVTTDKYASIIDDYVTVGHNVVIHGAHLRDYAFVGISATVMDNVTIGKFGFVAAGALVPPNFEVPEKTLVAGVPAKIIRPLKDSEIEMIKSVAMSYAKRAEVYKKSLKAIPFESPEIQTR